MIPTTSKYYQLMTERLLSLLYIWCFATLTSCFAQKESISDLYAQLDRAIEQSQHYTKLKESSIAQLKELIHQEKIRSCSSIPIANLFRI